MLLLLEELLVGFDLHGRTNLLLHVLEEDEEHGNGEEDSKSTNYHTAYDAYTDCAVAVSTCAAGKDKR